MSLQMIETLYAQYLPALIRCCARMLRYDQQYLPAVEDIVQDVFLSAMRNHEMLMTHPNPYGWLVTVCRHRCQDMLRHEQRRSTHLGDPLPLDEARPTQAHEDVVQAWLQHLDSTQVIDSLQNRLSPMEQQVFKVFYLEGCSVQQTSSELEMSVSAVSDAARRIRKKARKPHLKRLMNVASPCLILLALVLKGGSL